MRHLKIGAGSIERKECNIQTFPFGLQIYAYYSSTKDALNWMLPNFQHNTILMFDDWSSYGDSQEFGQQRALAEFLQENPQLSVEPLWSFANHGQAFLLLDVHIN